MSYYNGSNAQMAFPFAQQSMQQRNISDLASTPGSVPPSINHYRDHLPHHLLHSHPPPQPTSVNTTNTPTGPGPAGQQSPPVPQQGSTSSESSISKDKENDGLEAKHVKKERKNRPGQKFGAKKKLWVWTWFVQDLGNPNMAVCDYCGKIITRQSSDKGLPKKLSEHLRTHKLSKDLINPLRSLPGNSINIAPSGMHLPYQGNYSSPSQQPINPPQGVNGNQLSIQNPLHNEHPDHGQQHPEPELPELNSKPAKFRRTNGMVNGVNGVNDVSNGVNPVNPVNQVPDPVHTVDDVMPHVPVNDRMMHNIHAPPPANHSHNPAFSRRYVSPHFDNKPYSVTKFHRHLLNFLADNKLSIRLLKLHSFQQLIYDLRPDSISDLLELTGLYSSFVEVSRADTNPESSNHDTSLSETNVENTLAQNLPRND